VNPSRWVEALGGGGAETSVQNCRSEKDRGREVIWISQYRCRKRADLCGTRS
jgi:hypothetical protein